MGLGVLTPPNLHHSICLAGRRSYNSVSTPMLHCDCPVAITSDGAVQRRRRAVDDINVTLSFSIVS